MMKCLKNYFFALLLAACGALLPSCEDDMLQQDVRDGRYIGFAVDMDFKNAHTRSGMGGIARAEVSDTVFTLNAEGLSEPLYLHAMVRDGIDGSGFTDNTPETRGAPVTTGSFYDSFGVLASAYTGSWSETSCLPDYMHNVEVTKASSWTTSYRWPGVRTLGFFAYAPYNCEGVLLSGNDVPGSPTITYTVPDDVTKQKDLLVASKLGVSASDGTADLSFKHALTAVKFKWGWSAMRVKIKKITFSNVYGSAVYNSKLSETAGAWSNYGDIKDFSVSLDADNFYEGDGADTSHDQPITADEQTFMMIPQKLPAGASLIVDYVIIDSWGDESNPSQINVGIGDNDWNMGETRTFCLSPYQDPPFIYQMLINENQSLQVYPKEGVVNELINVSSGYISVDAFENELTWQYMFIQKDENGNYREIPCPDWIKDVRTENSGKPSGSFFEFSLRASADDASGTHNKRLKQAAPVRGTYDLSTKGGTTEMNTANCYIINAPGKYSLPLVYGNAITKGMESHGSYIMSLAGTGVLSHFVNHLDAPITDPYIYKNAGCTPKDAVLLWQDAKNLVTNVALAADGHSLTFEVGSSTIKEGNAVVAVRDANSDIMWSWHIWVTDYVPGLDATVEAVYEPAAQARDKVVKFQGIPRTAMGSPLGWCNDRAIEGERSVRVLFYQSDSPKRLDEVLFSCGEDGIPRPWSIPEDDVMEAYVEFHPCVMTIRQKILINEGNSTLYQFGRKDPMLGGIRNASGATVDKSCYSDSGYAFNKSGVGNVSLGTAIRNPHVFYNITNAASGDWCSTSYTNLWDNVSTQTRQMAGVFKTIYDPSPAGYRIAESGVFEIATYGGSKVSGEGYYGVRFNSPYTSPTDFATKFGWMFYCNEMPGEGRYDTAGGTIFYPAAGYRFSSGGRVYEVGDVGMYWASDAGFTFSKNNIAPIANNKRVTGMSLRPVRDEEFWW